jgi:signal peptidase I
LQSAGGGTGGGAGAQSDGSFKLLVVLAHVVVVQHFVREYVFSVTFCVGSSMLPTFDEARDLALLERVSFMFRQPQRGDVVTVRVRRWWEWRSLWAWSKRTGRCAGLWW